MANRPEAGERAGGRAALALTRRCAGITLAVAAAGWALTCWTRRNLRVFRVAGASMLPSYRHGDMLVVRRVPPRVIRPGDVVVLDNGEHDEPHPSATYWIIKRVAAIPGDVVSPGILPAGQDATVPPGQLVLLGDNPAQSTDSRHNGYFPASRTVGRVIGVRSRTGST
jgi:signal peptidase I